MFCGAVAVVVIVVIVVLAWAGFYRNPHPFKTKWCATQKPRTHAMLVAAVFLSRQHDGATQPALAGHTKRFRLLTVDC